MTDDPTRDRAKAADLVAAATSATGRPALSDQLHNDLARGRGVTLVERADGAAAALAQLAERSGAWTMQIVVAPALRDRSALISSLAARAVAAVATRGGGRVDWWVDDVAVTDDEIAASAGFAPGRDLLQMRRGLPADRRATVPTRRFTPGDAVAWVTVNNRAFADHPEQSGWTVDELARRSDEPWFDPDGFRLYETDGRLAAFCWTKVHHDETPAAGEIYVIGVDPDFQGRGLGAELTLAGLDWMTDHGLTTALLYVDGANTTAVRLYRRLGFETARTDRAYTRTVTPTPH